MHGIVRRNVLAMWYVYELLTEYAVQWYICIATRRCVLINVGEKYEKICDNTHLPFDYYNFIVSSRC